MDVTVHMAVLLSIVTGYLAYRAAHGWIRFSRWWCERRTYGPVRYLPGEPFTVRAAAARLRSRMPKHRYALVVVGG